MRIRLAFATVLLSLIFLIGYSMHSYLAGGADTTKIKEFSASDRIPRTFPTDSVPFSGPYTRAFNDIQEVQIQAAMALGIAPLESELLIDSLLHTGTLVKVEECLLYETSESSLPYLIPDAKELLDEIAMQFQLRINNPQQLRLTSCLRTDKSIESLRRRNRNSVKNSCHLYGTTFDISYGKMTPQDKCILAQVLYEMQQAGHCYVKYEYKQPCFHITVRPLE